MPRLREALVGKGREGRASRWGKMVFPPHSGMEKMGKHFR